MGETLEPTPIADLVERIVKELVDRPEQVKVSVIEGQVNTVIEVETGPGEMGKVLGRQGRTADALRTLLIAMGGRYKRRFFLEIVDPAGEGQRPVRLNQGGDRYRD